MTLIYNIIFCTHGGIPQYKIDPHLDLNTVLMDSPISPLAEWLYNFESNTYTYNPIYPEPRTPLSASSSLSSSHSSMSSLRSYIAKSERRKSQGNSHQMSTMPTYIRAPPTNPPSLPRNAHELTTTACSRRAGTGTSGTAHSAACTGCPVYHLFP